MSSINGIHFSTNGGSVPFPNTIKSTHREEECCSSLHTHCPECCDSEMHFSTDGGSVPYPNGPMYYTPNIHFSTDGDSVPYPHDVSHNVESFDDSLEDRSEVFNGDGLQRTEEEELARWLYY